MAKALTVLFTFLFGLLIWSDLQAGCPEVFAAKCVGCHGATAEGKAMPKVPPIDKAKADAALADTINKGKPPMMPSYAGKLPAECNEAAMAAHLKSLK